jgi:hypothetical protein
MSDAVLAPLPSSQPTPRRAARVKQFFVDRFPLAPNLLAAVFGACVPVVDIAAGGAVALRPVHAAAIVAVFCIALLMRVYDELKDVETDKRLAAAGDPLFASRPIVTGKLRVDDLHLLRRFGLTLGVIAIAVVAAYAPLAGAAFVGTLVVVWFSSRWFFWPRIQGDVLLAFLTHNPIAGLVGVATVLTAVSTSTAAPSLALCAAIVGVSWFPVSAWEVARKVRAPSDETAYQTYSKRLGVGRAAALLATCFLLAGASAAGVCVLANAPWGVAVVVALSTGLGLVQIARYAHAPTTQTARLRPYADVHAIVCSALPAFSLLFLR